MTPSSWHRISPGLAFRTPGHRNDRPFLAAQVAFFPFNASGYAGFPRDHVMVVCDSRIQAQKSAEALDAFNERIASYELGVYWVRSRFPHHAPRIEHLRDISPERLGAEPAEICRILLEVPESATAWQLRDELGDKTYERVTSGHGPRAIYSLRARLLYGIAECERSNHCHDLLREGRMQELGRLMTVSHDGDRVLRQDAQRVSYCTGDEFINACIQNLHSQDPGRRAAAKLRMQPGGYACSVPQIDRMVDIALAAPGILGAQLAGAGFGGCMMVLAKAEAARDLIQRMDESYYKPENLRPGAIIVTPIAGCSALRIDGG